MIKVDKVTLYDGSVTKIKYSYSDNLPVDKLVVYVNGSGQNTYDNKRMNHKGGFFNYHDYFRNEFLSHGIAYCSYNTRGIDLGDTAPLFITTDENEYKKYLPLNSVKDVEAIVNYLTGLPEFQSAKVFLLGWSEGTVIAPLVALNKKVRVDALLLAGYENVNLKDTLIWQLNGNSSYINIKKYFDKEKRGYFTRNDFEAADPKITKALFGDLTFDCIDVNSDGKIDVFDFAAHQKPYLDLLLDAISKNDDDFFKTKYINPIIRLTSGWFNQHFTLAPNKDILPILELPIYIFHGEDDGSCPVEYAEDIRNDFIKSGKTNLFVNIFADHDHDLNFGYWLYSGTIPPGIACIFNTVYQI